MVKKGDRVTIDGKTAEVIGWWGQGKHRVFQLDDGRTVFDLHLLLEDGDARVTLEDEGSDLSYPEEASPLEELAKEHPAPDAFWDEDEDDGQED
jgi:hypothetical protein